MSRMLRPPPSLGLASQSDCAREGEAITVCVVIMGETVFTRPLPNNLSHGDAAFRDH
jgi:hypothetical protein